MAGRIGSCLLNGDPVWRRVDDENGVAILGDDIERSPFVCGHPDLSRDGSPVTVPLRILDVRDRFEVCGVDADRIQAEMVQFHSFGDWANLSLVNKSIRLLTPAIHSGETPSVVAGSLPNPASSRFINDPVLGPADTTRAVARSVTLILACDVADTKVRALGNRGGKFAPALTDAGWIRRYSQFLSSARSARPSFRRSTLSASFIWARSSVPHRADVKSRTWKYTLARCAFEFFKSLHAVPLYGGNYNVLYHKKGG